MRAALPLLASLCLLAACGETRQTAAPTISYRISGNDLSEANASAAGYCQQYGMAARLRSLEPSGSASIALYACRAQDART